MVIVEGWKEREIPNFPVPKNAMKIMAEQFGMPIHTEYKQCRDCIHNNKDSPCPCDSCEQKTPTNFEEE